jgi:SAM-dependent methyltransferase
MGLRARARRKLRRVTARIQPSPRCKVCGSATTAEQAYSRPFHRCTDCTFVFTEDFDRATLDRGLGMEGSWTGPGGGGYREYYLVKMLADELDMRRFLLFGTGNTPTFARLLDEGVDVVGCDISPDVVAHKKSQHGDETFHTPDQLPPRRSFDGIVSVEVFEHFVEPKQSLALLFDRLNDGGVICGTTDFFPGTSIEDDNDPGYMSHEGHVAYWCERSLGRMVEPLDREVTAFEMVRPGSVLPDEKFGQLWPRKRVFFIHEAACRPYFAGKFARTPILPIDQP